LALGRVAATRCAAQCGRIHHLALARPRATRCRSSLSRMSTSKRTTSPPGPRLVRALTSMPSRWASSRRAGGRQHHRTASGPRSASTKWLKSELRRFLGRAPTSSSKRATLSGNERGTGCAEPCWRCAPLPLCRSMSRLPSQAGPVLPPAPGRGSSRPLVCNGPARHPRVAHMHVPSVSISVPLYSGAYVSTLSTLRVSRGLSEPRSRCSLGAVRSPVRHMN